jgi:hypothetical protein
MILFLPYIEMTVKASPVETRTIVPVGIVRGWLRKMPIIAKPLIVKASLNRIKAIALLICAKHGPVEM